VCLLAAIGLLRYLMWARSLTSWIVVPIAFMVSISLMGDLDEHDGKTVLTHLLGWEPPLVVQWLAVVSVASLLLSPLLAIGWRRSYFEARWW
jgi:hypothetical protein